MIHINEEDALMIEKFKGILNKGYYCNSNQVTSLYNKVLEKNVTNTNCSTCLRRRVQELYDALQRQRDREKKELQNAQESGFTTVEEAKEEGKKIIEEIKEREETSDGNNAKPHKTTRGKKGKRQNGV